MKNCIFIIVLSVNVLNVVINTVNYVWLSYRNKSTI